MAGATLHHSGTTATLRGYQEGTCQVSDQASLLSSPAAPMHPVLLYALQHNNCCMAPIEAPVLWWTGSAIGVRCIVAAPGRGGPGGHAIPTTAGRLPSQLSTQAQGCTSTGTTGGGAAGEAATHGPSCHMSNHHESHTLLACPVPAWTVERPLLHVQPLHALTAACLLTGQHTTDSVAWRVQAKA